jgi:hypothetical protein
LKKYTAWKLFSLLFSIVLGVFYYYLIQISVTDLKHSSPNASTFSFNITSNLDQNVKLQIATDRFKLHSFECNKVKITFPFKKMQWFEGLGEQVSVPLQKGDNLCKVHTINSFTSYIPVVKQKITFFNYTVLFILLGIPLFTLVFKTFMWILTKIRSRKSVKKDTFNTYKHPGHQIPKILLTVLLAGIIIRLFYFDKFSIMNFQHDWHGHIEFIKYIAEHWTLPLASKGLEYPQQPLYYWITAGLYALFTHFGLSEQDALFGLGFFSLFCSMIFLYYSYRFMRLMTNNVWVQTVAMVFVSLTPSLVYMSARINNDVLVMALSAFSLYYIVKSYQDGFEKGFYAALTGVSLLFITKISAAPMELLLFSLLLVAYVKAEEGTVSMVRKALYLFGVVGLFLLGFTLLRVYLPVEGTFHMVNSSAYFPKQSIEALDLAYFGTFHITSLLNAGYSYVFGHDAIRFSFLTYQYGTMFFGEFDYAYFVNKMPYLLYVMQAVLALGLIFILGFVLFIIRIYRHSLLENLLFVTLLLNLLLILKFIFDYPSVCNTDFRYFVGSFVLLGFFFAKGLEPMYNIKGLRYVINVWVGLLAISEVVFFTLLIAG